MAVISLVIALPGALYFGNDGTDLVILNFNTWTGNGFDPNAKQPVFPAIISYLIRLLPPLYVLTSIPIHGLTMSLNIMELFPEKYKNKKWLIVLIKLLCILPSTILAGLVRDLGVIIEFTGLLGFLVILTPAVLLLRAHKECKKEYGTLSTPFAYKYLSKDWVIIGIICFNLVGVCLTVYSLISEVIE